MRFEIIDEAGEIIWGFTVRGATTEWIVRNAAHLANIIRLWRGADMVFRPLV
jgi:hypothetical protein